MRDFPGAEVDAGAAELAGKPGMVSGIGEIQQSLDRSRDAARNSLFIGRMKPIFIPGSSEASLPTVKGLLKRQNLPAAWGVFRPARVAAEM